MGVSPVNRLSWVVACLLQVALALTALGCRDPEQVATENKLRRARAAIDEAKAHLAKEEPREAIRVLRRAVSAWPTDPTPYLLLAEAQRKAGNDTAAALALKQAQEYASSEPSVRLQLAQLLQLMGHLQPALKLFLELRDAMQLSHEGVLNLARLQSRLGDPEGAFKTLEFIQSKRPDDVDAKIVEGEVLLSSGEELLAARLMDRLIEQHPSSAPVRLLRARYFLSSGYPQLAEQDLDALSPASKEQRDAVELRARVLNQLKRYDESVGVLKPLLEARPQDSVLIALLAETELALGNTDRAQELVDKALAIRANDARALYVRARALETKGELKEATYGYQLVLKTDPAFGPALSRVWRIYLHRGEKAEAMGALERLFYINEASLEEKVALAELCADTGTQLALGRKLIDEALRKEPANVRFRLIKGKLPSGAARAPIVIIRNRVNQ